jgi:hypothetical protein
MFYLFIFPSFLPCYFSKSLRVVITRRFADSSVIPSSRHNWWRVPAGQPAAPANNDFSSIALRLSLLLYNCFSDSSRALYPHRKLDAHHVCVCVCGCVGGALIDAKLPISLATQGISSSVVYNIPLLLLGVAISNRRSPAICSSLTATLAYPSASES